MKKNILLPALILCGAVISLQAHANDFEASADQADQRADQGIDWSHVTGPELGSNDVTRDFANPPNTLNDTLSNAFTAWQPNQFNIEQANTSTGRAQRLAVVGEVGSSFQAGTATETTTQQYYSEEHQNNASE